MSGGLPIDRLFCGDAVELSREKLPDDSIDGIATDPPYGLEFMGEEWDSFRAKNVIKQTCGVMARKGFGALPSFSAKDNVKCPICGKWEYDHEGRKCECGGANLWSRLMFGGTYQLWTTSWAEEALRVLKPGASMLVMGGTRTYHRMACGVEDAGFIIKDCLAWCYNSGFPKAQDLGKMIDKRGKENEKYLVLSKELCDYLKNSRLKRGLSQNQVAEHFPSKTGGLTGCVWNWENGANIPTMAQWKKLKELLELKNEKFNELIERAIIRRIEAQREIVGKGVSGKSDSHEVYNFGENFGGKFDITAPATDLAKKWDGWKVGGLKPAYEPILLAVKPPEGSYTDNVLKYGVGAINVDGCRIPRSSDDRFEYGVNGDEASLPGSGVCYGDWKERHVYEPHNKGRYPANMIRTDRFHDGYDRFYFIPKAEREERWFKCKVCAVCQDGTHRRNHDDHALHCHECGVNFPDTEDGREAHKNHRTESNIIAHPTVKPVSLGEHLIKLVTREGQIVADFFCGLGSFSEAARRQNRHYIAFDNNPDYIEIAKHRLAAIPRPLEVYA